MRKGDGLCGLICEKVEFGIILRIGDFVYKTLGIVNINVKN